jgi:CubicO group peptidase (beta-lactamase class C family)
MFVREAIEAATGMAAGDALQSLIFAPLKLSSVEWATRASDFSDIHWPAGRGYHPGWVYHGCLTGTATDAARLLHALFGGDLLSRDTLATMLEPYPLGGAIAGRPWSECGYGLGFMAGRMGEAGRAFGHSGAGPFSVNAVYHFPDRPVAITVAVFTDGTDEGRAENEARRLALESG